MNQSQDAIFHIKKNIFRLPCISYTLEEITLLIHVYYHSPTENKTQFDGKIGVGLF